MAPVPFNKLLFLMLYFYSGDEYFLSSIDSCSNHTVKKDVDGFIKDEPFAIAKFFLG